MKWLDRIKGKKATPHTSSHPALDVKNENTLTNRFSFHLIKCCDILRQADHGYTHDDEYDLYAVAYVVSDFAVSVAGKNRERATKAILDFLIGKLAIHYPSKTLSDFRSRIDFYGNVVRGTPLHAHCLPGVDLSDANPISCCAIAFCDCLMNPMYISDYSDYWPPAFDAFEALGVATNIFSPLNSELAALYNDIYTYST